MFKGGPTVIIVTPIAVNDAHPSLLYPVGHRARTGALPLLRKVTLDPTPNAGRGRGRGKDDAKLEEEVGDVLINIVASSRHLQCIALDVIPSNANNF